MSHPTSHAQFIGRSLPKPYGHAVSALRHQMVRTIRGAVMTGDTPTAMRLYRAVAGPIAAQKLAKKDALAELKKWLVQEP